MARHQVSPTFIEVDCPCGRKLRAKADQAGSEIRCWDCQRMVMVPVPKQAGRLTRGLSAGALGVIGGPGLNAVLIASAVVTAVLAIPEYGVWCSTIVLMMGASAYGAILRGAARSGPEGAEPDWWASLLPRSVPAGLAAGAMAGGTSIPFWYANSGLYRSPHWGPASLAVAVATWTLIPVVMLDLHGVTVAGGRAAGIREAVRLLARHPVASILAWSVIPLALLSLEAAFGLIFAIPGYLPFFALDYMPMPRLTPEIFVYDGIAYFQYLDFREYPPGPFIAGYFAGLRRGYSFVAAIPASLSMSTRAGLRGEVIGIPDVFYTFIRVLLTAVEVAWLLAAAAIQARWLGSIAALEKEQPA